MTDSGDQDGDESSSGALRGVTVRLFGGAAVLHDGAPVGGAAAHRHRVALLAVLATSRRPVSRDKLIALLWPERDTESARNLLKVALHALRKVLGEGAIRSIGDQLAVEETALRCDVMDFQAALDAEADERAVGWYVGPFLDGFHLKEAPDFERLVGEERARLVQAYHGALERLAGAAEGRRDYAAAVRWWLRLAGHDPLRAGVSVRLMRALAVGGDVAGALRHAEIHTRLARETLDLDPDPAVVRLASELRAAPAGRMPAAPNVGVTPDGGAAPMAVDPLPSTGRRWRWGRVAAALVVVLVIGLLLSRRRPGGGSAHPPPDPAASPVADGGALSLAGHGLASTSPGQVVTAQLDGIALDLMIRYDPVATDTGPQVIFYNGNAALTGWGLLALPADPSNPDGTIAVLAGGLVIDPTPVVLTRGVWQHLVAARRDGRVTLTLDDLTFSVGVLPVNPVGRRYGHEETTTLGGAIAPDGRPMEGFHGAIARAGIRDLSSGYWIERWDFGEGQGATTTGERGTVLRVVNAVWLGGDKR